ncbi:O-antigen ligase family protein [Sphaerisporangium fuscum]|uniref:O-antigen ligase family protein n=1 Tax=Sphaerisporangium fuscum TaxID=2835868 RepID=UPI001BDBCF0C|nr:O-antigen ligase family protein [Sphaerisporangium fuscum]
MTSTSEAARTKAPAQRPPERQTRLPRLRLDPVSIMTFFLIVLFVLPARYRVGALGAAGAPASMVAVLLIVWYLLSTLSPRWTPIRGRQPVRPVIMFFCLSILASYVAAMTRPLSTDELNVADLGLILAAGWAGIALVTADGINSMDRLETLRHRLVLGASFSAFIAMLQFFSGVEITQYMALPGLTESTSAVLFERDGFFRPAGTATHPIELGVTLAAVLPLALHGAIYCDDRKQRRKRWLMVALIAGVLPMSVSRSAILGLFIVMVVLLPTWPSEWRLRAILIFGFGAIVMRLMIPGLIGTVLNLVTVIGSDESSTTRTGDYDAVIAAVQLRPFFGQGFATYLPRIYRVIDNQYLMSALETGIVGVLALMAFLFSGWSLARRARRAATDEPTRHLAQCLAASTGVAIFGFGTFDAFSFPMITNVMFLILGICGALWRLQTQPAGEVR